MLERIYKKMIHDTREILDVYREDAREMNAVTDNSEELKNNLEAILRRIKTNKV